MLYEFKHLPRFDDVTTCNIRTAQHKHLLKIEIHSLVEAVLSKEPMLFDSGGTLGNATFDILRDTSHLADHIMFNLLILDLDNLTMVLEHCMSTSLVRLLALFYEMAHGGVKQQYQHTGKVARPGPETVESPERNEEAYFALVDFITSSVARHLMRSAYSTAW